MRYLFFFLILVSSLLSAKQTERYYQTHRLIKHAQFARAVRAGEVGAEVHGGTTAPSCTKPALRQRIRCDRRYESHLFDHENRHYQASLTFR